MTLFFSEDNFKQYFFNQFRSDLSNFLRDYRLGLGEKYTLCSNHDGVIFYPYAEATNDRIRPSNKAEYDYYFVVCLIYYHLFVYKMYMKDAELAKSLCRCTGFPLIYCGLGGMMHPYQVAYEMRLLPDGKDRNLLHKFILSAAPFMETEMMPFLEGKQEVPNKAEYKKVVDGMKGKLVNYWDSVMADLGTEDVLAKYPSTLEHPICRVEMTPKLTDYYREHGYILTMLEDLLNKKD